MNSDTKKQGRKLREKNIRLLKEKFCDFSLTKLEWMTCYQNIYFIYRHPWYSFVGKYLKFIKDFGKIFPLLVKWDDLKQNIRTVISWVDEGMLTCAQLEICLHFDDWLEVLLLSNSKLL